MAVILLGWEVVILSVIVPSYMLPSPVAVLTALFGDLPTILFHAKFTLLESFYGLLIGIALAFVFATMMDRFRVMDQAFYPIMIITQTIPTIAIAPILVLWMGFGMAPMGASRAQIFRHVKFPGALPQFFSGLKISASYAVVGAVVSEWLGGFNGLGVYMTRVKKAYSFDKMFAVIIFIVIISLLLLLAVNIVSRITMPWLQVEKEKNNE